MATSSVQKPNTLPQDLFIKLRTDILTGVFPAGEKLSEQKICDHYMVSRTPVREAFQKLELEGLIEIVPNRGAFILEQSKDDIDDVYEIMKALEAVAVKLAIERITDEELEELKESYELMEFYTMKGDAQKLSAINFRFHSAIYNATKNRMLIQTLTSCQMRIRSNKYRKQDWTEFFEEELAEHEAIYMAIVAKDKDTAVAAATRHIRQGKRRAAV